MKWLRNTVLALSMLTAGAVAALAVNQQTIALKFAIWETPVSLSIFWWLLLVFVIGLGVGLLNGVWVNLKRRLENRRLQQSLASANAELARLRELSS